MDWDRDGKTWPDYADSRFVKASGLRWRVVVKGRGPVLLLLHGTGASAHSWAGAANLLAERFTVVAPDLPGHAFTAAPYTADLSLPAMARALGDLMTALDLAPALVAGHSAGAAILIEMCLARTIAPNAIVSFNGALLPFHGLAGKIFSPLAKLLVLNPFIPGLLNWRAAHPGAVQKILSGTGSVIDAASIAHYERLFRDQAHVSATLRMMADWDLDSFARRIPRLETPLVLIAGDKDAAVPPQTANRIKALVKTAKVVMMPGTGHLSHEEDPATAASLIENALIPLAQDR